MKEGGGGGGGGGGGRWAGAGGFYKFFRKKYCGPGDHRAQYCQKVFVEMYFEAFPINFNFLIKACLCWYFRVVLTIISKSKKCFIFSIIFKKSYSKKFFIKFLIFFAISKFFCRNKIKLINSLINYHWLFNNQSIEFCSSYKNDYIIHERELTFKKNTVLCF